MSTRRKPDRLNISHREQKLTFPVGMVSHIEYVLGYRFRNKVQP